MIQFSLKDEMNLCNSFVDKSNFSQLLVVETPAKNVKSVCCKQSNTMNFRLFNYFAKIKVKDELKVKLSNCLQNGKALQK